MRIELNLKNVYYKRHTYLFLFLIFSCEQLFSQKSGQTVTIVNNTSSQLNLYYHDALYLGSPLYLGVGDKENFTINTTSYIIVSDKKQFMYRIQNGDSIVFYKNDIIKSKGPNSNINENLNKIYLNGAQIRAIAPIRFKQDISTYYNYCSIILSEQSNLINQIEKVNNLNGSERKIIENLIKVSYIGFLLKPKYKLQFAFKDSVQKIRNEIYNSLSSIEYENSAPYWAPSLQMINLFTDKKDDYQKKIDVIKSFGSYSAYTDFMIAKIIVNDYVKKDSFSISTSILNLISNHAIKKDINEYINKKRANPIIETNENILYDAKGYRINLNDLLSNGGYDYYLIDFWATWCQPCIENFRSSKLTKEKEKKFKVKVLYFSLDENFEKWKNFVKSGRFLFDFTNSYFLTGSFKANLCETNSITSIPRAILISKEGVIINSNAPSLSDPELLTLLKRYGTMED